jgi:hypothetical protein
MERGSSIGTQFILPVKEPSAASSMKNAPGGYGKRLDRLTAISFAQYKSKTNETTNYASLYYASGPLVSIINSYQLVSFQGQAPCIIARPRMGMGRSFSADYPNPINALQARKFFRTWILNGRIFYYYSVLQRKRLEKMEGICADSFFPRSQRFRWKSSNLHIRRERTPRDLATAEGNSHFPTVCSVFRFSR